MAEESKIKGIEQGRANKAYDYVLCALNEAKLKGDEQAKQYKDQHEAKLKGDEKAKQYKDQYESAVKKMPVYIKNNGLGQTLAFYKKRNDAHDMIYEQLADWLQKYDRKKLVDEGDLVQEVIKMSSSEYRQVSKEAMALLLWMKRFVDGLIK